MPNLSFPFFHLTGIISASGNLTAAAKVTNYVSCDERDVGALWQVNLINDSSFLE